MNFKGTTIIAVKKGTQLAIAGDGQVTVGATVMKHKAKKIRTMYNGKVLAGFAGSVADAFALFERFEGKLEKFSGNLERAAVELAKDWRLDRYLRRLEALLLIANVEKILVISGQGEVIEPDENIAGIGSGGAYAQAAAKALLTYSDLSAKEIAKIAMEIASSICIYTNKEISLEVLE